MKTYTTAEAAELLGLAESTLRVFIHRKKVKPWKRGRDYVWLPANIAAMKKRNKNPGPVKKA